jgi:hypothetical protein
MSVRSSEPIHLLCDVDLPSGYNAVMKVLEVFLICGVAKHAFTTRAFA